MNDQILWTYLQINNLQISPKNLFENKFAKK